ncbi:MAG: GntR family transcriptional regulator, partial [Boseongicola sp.]|nr:GntR family transcriptional regulator [Boseongicola sp.]
MAYDKLMASIRTGVYRPGDRLREEEVGDRLKISRTPVREALRRLEAEGVVEHRPRQGAVVRQLNHAEVVELYEMRVVLAR